MAMTNFTNIFTSAIAGQWSSSVFTNTMDDAHTGPHEIPPEQLMKLAARLSGLDYRLEDISEWVWVSRGAMLKLTFKDGKILALSPEWFS